MPLLYLAKLMLSEPLHSNTKRGKNSTKKTDKSVSA